jgi:hypothetical protein
MRQAPHIATLLISNSNFRLYVGFSPLFSNIKCITNRNQHYAASRTAGIITGSSFFRTYRP